MKDLRTAKTRKKYIKLIKSGHLEGECAMCNEFQHATMSNEPESARWARKNSLVKQFEHWVVVRNRFPYDLIADVNDMLVTKRHTTFECLNAEELKEYGEIKTGFIERNYHIILESLANGRSFPHHFHVNLIVYKGRTVPKESITEQIKKGLYK